MAPRARKLTEPLETITFAFGLFLALAIGFSITSALISRSVSFGGLGHTTICATDTNIGFDSGDLPTHDPAFATRPGASLSDNANLAACVSHPSLEQRLLSTLTSLPGLLLLVGVLLLLWRIMRSAGRGGPFTPHIAAMLRSLGWLIIVGTAAVSVVQQLATDLLLNTMLVHGVGLLSDTIGAAVTALFPERILIGGALLTFARIMRLGAAMDDEIKATV